MAKVAYTQYYTECGHDYEPIKVTGKWKLESGPYYTDKMFVEVKGWFLKHWVSEDNIYFLGEETSVEFNCNEKD